MCFKKQNKQERNESSDSMAAPLRQQCFKVPAAIWGSRSPLGLPLPQSLQEPGGKVGVVNPTGLHGAADSVLGLNKEINCLAGHRPACSCR